MAFKQQDTSFVGFVEEFFKVPVNFPAGVWAFYIKGKQTTLVNISQRSNYANQTDASFISTFVAGGNEALKDVKGINTQIDGGKFIRNPLGTLTALGKKTFADITSMDEISADIRSDIIEGLTKGNLSHRNRDIVSPQSDVVKILKKIGMNIVSPEDLVESVPPAGAGQPAIKKSRIQLLGSPNQIGNQPLTVDDQAEDRQILEQGKNRDASIKAYSQMAGNVTALAGYMEDTKPRQKYYTGSVISYNRTVASELGVNLDDVLTVKGRRGFDKDAGRVRIYDSAGSFKKELIAGNANFASVKENLNNLLSDETRLKKALSFDTQDALWANLDPTAKDGMRDFLKSEFMNQEDYSKFKSSITQKTAFEEDLESGLGAPITAFMAKQKYSGKEEDDRESLLQKGIIDREKNKAALEAQLKAQINTAVLKAKISEAAKIQVEQKALADLTSGLAPGLPPIIDLTDNRIPAQTLATINAQKADAGAKAIERFDSATRSMNVSNNLFFASSMNELLESIEKGEFVKVALITSRVIGLTPFLNSKLGTPEEYVQILDKIGLPNFNVGTGVYQAVRLKNFALKQVGITFDPTDAASTTQLPMLPGAINKITGGKAFDSDVWVEWSKDSGVPGRPKWTQTRVSPSRAEGLFGEGGLHDTLKKAWGPSGGFFTEAGFANIDIYNPKKLLEDIPATRTFFESLKTGADSVIANNGTATTPFEKLAQSMGFTDFKPDPFGVPLTGPGGTYIYEKFDIFKAQYAKLTDAGTGGFALLEQLSDPASHPGTFALGLSDRWDFLERIFKEGKIAQFVNKAGNTIRFNGLLQRYNKASNALYTFFYRELLGGAYAGSNILLKGLTKVLSPLRGLGFADEAYISQAVGNWGVVKWFSSISTKFLNLAGNPSLATSATSKFLVKFLSSALLKSAGWLAGAVGGSLTGGISYILAAVGDIGMAFVKGLWQTRNIGKAFASAIEVLKAKIRTLNKVLMAIVVSCGTCIMIPLLFIFVIAGMVAPLESFLGGGAYENLVVSQKIKVIKTAVKSGDSIQYTVTITNLTGSAELPAETVTISALTDQLKYSKPKSEGCGIVDVAGDPTRQYGSITLPTLDSLPVKTIDAGKSLVIGPTTLTNIVTTDGTYLNNIEIETTEDPGKKNSSAVSTVYGAGGCADCPTGWPTQPFRLSQGTYTTDTHKNAEALDLAAAPMQPIYATHTGIVSIGVYDTCKDSACDYGNYVKVLSPMGFESMYAHMTKFADNLTEGQEVSATTLIGYVGTTGNSTGNHLHYEFRNTSIECIPGAKLEMKNIQDGSYIPENIPVPHCVEIVNCKMER